MPTELKSTLTEEISTVKSWHYAGPEADFPENGGLCFLIDGQQIAVFNFSRRNAWYATQNECPHKKQMILSRGMIGSENDEPKVACPFHKKTYSLATGKNLNGDECPLATYPVRVESGSVYVGMKN